MSGALLGPSFPQEEIEDFLRSQEVEFTRLGSDEKLCEETAEILASGQVVGWFQGRMEFGPRALGSRSILGDPRCREMQRTMNLKIKFRESFRPFAPSVLRERVHEWFDMPEEGDFPYMQFVTTVHQAHRVEGAGGVAGLARLDEQRSTIPAVTHVDDSARVQTVDSERTPLYHQLISAFEKRTGCPLLVNTSFNVRGEPIVCTPADAWRVFQSTEMDVLVLGRCVIRKGSEVPEQVRGEEQSGVAGA
jgi:carbamoyltransferase